MCSLISDSLMYSAIAYDILPFTFYIRRVECRLSTEVCDDNCQDVFLWNSCTITFLLVASTCKQYHAEVRAYTLWGFMYARVDVMHTSAYDSYAMDVYL
jgi:hypothetical protein